jgi:hypothetical protein
MIGLILFVILIGVGLFYVVFYMKPTGNVPSTPAPPSVPSAPTTKLSAEQVEHFLEQNKNYKRWPVKIAKQPYPATWTHTNHQVVFTIGASNNVSLHIQPNNAEDIDCSNLLQGENDPTSKAEALVRRSRDNLLKIGCQDN